MKINVRIEIPKNSKVKYEWDSKTNELFIDRVLFGANSYPQNYGSVPNTLDDDGDPLDAIVIGNESWFPGCIVSVRVLGLMPMIDDDEEDSKLICIIDSDPRLSDIKSIGEVSPHILAEIINFFESYKKLENKKVKVGKIKGENDAKKAIQRCTKLYQKQQSK